MLPITTTTTRYNNNNNRRQQQSRRITIRPKNYKVGFCTRVCHILTFIPIALLCLERLYIPFELIGGNNGDGSLTSYLDVENTAKTTTLKNPLVGGENNNNKNPSLAKLTDTYSWKKLCSDKTVLLTDVNNNNNNNNTENNMMVHKQQQQIPMIIHQTGKVRCVTPLFEQMAMKWKLKFTTTTTTTTTGGEGGYYSYYFHDEDAVNRLLEMDFPEFPHLRTILRNCVTNGTIKSDLWRYLVLWVYGGVYADFDTIPNELTIDTIRPEYDALFVVEQYHILSQWFMAVSPKHPLMFYAIQHSLLNLLQAEDTQKIGAHIKTGPHALHKAYIDFRKDVGVLVDPIGAGYKPVSSGTYHGTGNRSITVLGVGEDENQFVQRTAISPADKKRDFKVMGMTHFSAYTKPTTKSSGKTCADAILDDITLAIHREESFI